MSIKTIIVDDEAPARRRLRKLLDEDQRCELIAEAENGKQAIDVIQRLNPELLILDIQLKDMTGFDVLREVRSSFNGVIIFITAFDEFAIKAFEANAVDYLLKPFKNVRFFDSLSRVLKAKENTQQPSLRELAAYFDQKTKIESTIKIEEGRVVHRINPDDVSFIQSEGYYCNFHIGQRVKMIRISLKLTQNILPKNFIRINRSVIINKHKIDSTKKLAKTMEITLITGDKFVAHDELDSI